jgi:hypothetical protein
MHTDTSKYYLQDNTTYTGVLATVNYQHRRGTTILEWMSKPSVWFINVGWGVDGKKLI